MKIGFIGVGIMGRPMAGHLQATGHDLLLVKNKSPLPQELLDGGAVVCASAAEVASGADVVILMLPDTPDVERVLLGPGGVVEGLSAGKAVVDIESRWAEARSPLQLTVQASLQESGGRPITRRLEQPIWPAERLPGLARCGADAQQDDVTGHGIGKNMTMTKIGECVEKSARCRQQE